jgi:hypothetical protein
MIMESLEYRVVEAKRKWNEISERVAKRIERAEVYLQSGRLSKPEAKYLEQKILMRGHIMRALLDANLGYLPGVLSSLNSVRISAHHALVGLFELELNYNGTFKNPEVISNSSTSQQSKISATKNRYRRVIDDVRKIFGVTT